MDYARSIGTYQLGKNRVQDWLFRQEFGDPVADSLTKMEKEDPVEYMKFLKIINAADVHAAGYNSYHERINILGYLGQLLARPIRLYNEENQLSAWQKAHGMFVRASA